MANRIVNMADSRSVYKELSTQIAELRAASAGTDSGPRDSIAIKALAQAIREFADRAARPKTRTASAITPSGPVTITINESRNGS